MVEVNIVKKLRETFVKYVLILSTLLRANEIDI